MHRRQMSTVCYSREEALALIMGAGQAIRQEHRLRGHLFGKAQNIGRVGPRWLKPCAVAACEGFGYCIGGR